MPRSPSIPKPYAKSGQWAVILRDPNTGYRKTVYLGPPDTAAARREYARVLADWEAADRTVTPPKTVVRRKVNRPDTVSVAEVVLNYFKTIKARHTDAVGKLTTHGLVVRNALRILREQAGHTAAIDFGPRALREVRTAMVESNRFSRKTVNENVRYIVAAFRWAVAEEMIPARVYDALTCLVSIRRGEVPGLRESKIVQPMSDDVVDATVPHLPTPLRGLVKLMRLTGARCGELTQLHPTDIDMTGKVWRAELVAHKTAYRGKSRVLLFGPQTQEVLKPFLHRLIDDPIFSPAESVAELRDKRRRSRTTPNRCGNRPGTNRKVSPQRRPGKAYTTEAVGKAIRRACKRAFPAPEGLSKAATKRWEDEHRWTAHQLRHAAATRIRKTYGLEAAAVILGHSSAVLTDATYALRDESVAVNVLAKIG